MIDYNHSKIEKKWQGKWAKDRIFEVDNKSKKPKFFILDMFPYPSGDGLHVGHPRGYVGSDVISNYKRMKGFNVLHPMGWDAFGLPAENYAIKTGIHPSITTKKNIKRFKEQMEMLGLSYDWTREINTTDPDYYKWTQWIFLKLFEKGLAYRKKLPINWCSSCKTGLANEEVIAGKCERCGAETTKKDIEQWILKITDYKEELLKGLEDLDWPEKIKEMQRNWIGKSEGADIEFPIIDNELSIKVFTTRPDTIFGATFMVLAPEHPLVAKITTSGKKKEVEHYIKETKKKSDIERQIERKIKTGVFTGTYALNPATKEKIPVYIADYVLPHYGYGAIMAVPAHDERDFEFATYREEIKKINVIEPDIEGLSTEEQNRIIDSGIPSKDLYIWENIGNKVKTELRLIKNAERCYSCEGILRNSDGFNGVYSKVAGKDIIKWLKENGFGKKAVNYRLKDWIFSRQRYWGEPIPLVFCQNCAEKVESQKLKTKSTEFSKGELLNPGWVVLPESELPLELPKLEKYQPTGTGESPLTQAKGWVETTCPKCGGKAMRETNTMPQWAGSCWYFVRYLDSKNKKEIADKKLIKHWLPVDFYIGGAEHAVLHLLYSRFWIKVLKDEKILSFDEPFKKLRTIGLILASDGQKMSKSRGNVVNPDEIIEKYGADTFRIYEMFMGPFDQPIAWDSNGIIGAKRFLDKVWKLEITKTDNIIVDRVVKKVTEDIEAEKFNTAIAFMMEFVNSASKGITKSNLEIFLKILTPFAPHISEEMWYGLGHKISILTEKWPGYKVIKDKEIELIIQINGKVRDTIMVKAETLEEKAKESALKSERIQSWLKDKKIKKTIFIKDKLINFVV